MSASAVCVLQHTCLQPESVHAFCLGTEYAQVQHKLSMVACRQVSIEEGDAKAREFSVMFIETSAKAGFNIKVGFHCCHAPFLLFYCHCTESLGSHPGAASDLDSVFDFKVEGVSFLYSKSF